MRYYIALIQAVSMTFYSFTLKELILLLLDYVTLIVKRTFAIRFAACS